MHRIIYLYTYTEYVQQNMSQVPPTNMMMTMMMMMVMMMLMMMVMMMVMMMMVVMMMVSVCVRGGGECSCAGCPEKTRAPLRMWGKNIGNAGPR